MEFFFLVEGQAKPTSEEDQLIQVGTGAFKDGFYDIAEKTIFNFYKTLSKHDRVLTFIIFSGGP